MPLPFRRRTVVALLALSSPTSLLAETAVRKALLPPDFEALRSTLETTLTPIAWGLFAITCAAALVVVPVHRVIHAKLQNRARRRPHDPTARTEAMQGALYLGASVVQLPTLVSTALFMLGAQQPPVLAALLVATIGVTAIGVFGPREPDDTTPP